VWEFYPPGGTPRLYGRQDACRYGNIRMKSSRRILHFVKSVYNAPMLATPELIRESGQLAQLEELLPQLQRVPLYRDVLARAGGGRADFNCFKTLPLIAKPEMRQNFPQNFLAAGQTLDSLLEKNLIELEHTSGTSSERLPVIFGRGWWNEQEERALRLNAFVATVLDEPPDARRVTLTSPSCNGLTCPTVWMSREQRTIGNVLFVNLARIPFTLSEAELAHMAEETAGWSPRFLDVDPVHGVRFALYCERHGLKFPSLKFILGSYEFVSVVHRRILERVFGVPVFNLYGSTETGHLLMENEAGKMKPSYDTAFLELVDTDAQGIGDLVVTTLTNDYMPLLRYRIGDLAEKHIEPYGNHYTVHGRARDALISAEGKRVTTWQVDQCFQEARGIAHYELRQNEAGVCVLRFVPDGAGPTEENLRGVTSQLEALLKSSSAIKTEPMPVLVPAASGKFRLTCRVAANNS
jgi:phenylacetate-CoA ligase